MGYACPVCGVEEADAEHLANHLAVTASLGREDHEEWLEEHVPDWSDRGPTELGERLTDHVQPVDTPDPVTGPEPSPGHGHTHDHAHEHGQGRPQGLEDALAHQSHQPGRGSLSAEARGVLEEARELTREMHDSGGDSGSNSNADSDSNPDAEPGSDLDSESAPDAGPADRSDQTDDADGNGTENENA